jgi:endonuclease/exonuclease/phosphatase family metal-dependent hydrolase
MRGSEAGGGADAEGEGASDSDDGAAGDSASDPFLDMSADLWPEDWLDLKGDIADEGELDGNTFGEGAFIVLNAHYDHIGVEARSNASRLILRIMDEIGRTLPVILLGDFNAEPGTEPITTLLGELSDAYDAPGINRHGPVGTFNGFEDREIYEARIDYVFHSPELIPLSYRVFDQRIEGLFPSDHFPVIVDLRWKR